jgi:glycosyltransferase involved in cell wall biosynthesis
MKILHILPSVNPVGGGPLEGVRQRGKRLLEMGHDVEVLSLDDPLQPFIEKYGLKVHAIGPSVGKFGYNAQLKPWLLQFASAYDSIVINGLWQYHAFGAWRALKNLKQPYFVFTHGMLDPWFKKAYPLKHLKKILYWHWADYRVLRDAAAVLFTSEDERMLARESFSRYRVNEEVVAYGTQNPPQDEERLRAHFLAAFPALAGTRNLLFLSRIQEKKGCDLLIDAFAQTAAQDPAFRLIMAGPDQTGWVATLKQQAAQLGISDRIHWLGMLQNDMKWGAFYTSEAFVLPSHQENFGIAVAEALGCGLPVLISNKVNIWREIEADHAGFVEHDTKEGTVKLLHRWLQLGPPERQALRVNARRSFEKRFTVDAMAQGMLDVLDKHR